MSGQQEPVFVYPLATRYDNAGDYAINRLLVQELARHGRVLIDATAAAEPFRSQFLNAARANGACEAFPGRIRSLRGLTAVARLRAASRPTVVLPPGLIGFGSPARLLRRILWLWAVRSGGGRIASFGVSIGRAWRDMSLLERQYLQLHDYIGLRDAREVEDVAKALPGSVRYCPDLAFLSRSVTPDAAEGRDGETVVCSFRAEGGAERARIVDAIRLLAADRSRRRRFTFCSQVAGDCDLARELHRATKVVADTELVAGVLDEAQARRRYRSAAVVLSNRLHGCLLALAEHVPALAVVGEKTERKVRGVLASAGLSDLVCRGEGSEALAARVRALDEGASDIRLLVADRFASQAAIARREIERACAGLAHRGHLDAPQ